ncbi:preprotein translocase subunit SecE [Facklamia sp. DSM 111018]|uniref:Preprotein translocase subunit SecE n=1 Tax=Facklamia lactis TaxID=2749967 RepID=A0ABS0LSU8_9LACT|nr:preprotein translocase subunit SecE [Facklamia lactis]MBG9981280.1 preprotein translocase subunit SecE [Facklamia lactis]MBG9987243.1 preprotein translocase subunit SecE [Facklamia lactis]
MNYFSGVASEMKKVTWPSIKDTNKFTWTVISMVVFFSLYFAVTDFAFNEFVNWIVRLGAKG